MKKNIFILALATAAGSAFAQNSIVSDLPGTFVDISTLTGTNAIFNGAVANDDVNTAINTTVTNSMFTATTLRVCTNGYVQFGGATGATTWTNTTIAAGPSTVSPVLPATTQALFPYWDDMLLSANSGGNVYWMEGPAAGFGLPAARGNVLIIQWNNVPHYNAGVPAGNATFQVQIFQNVVNNVAAQMLYSDVVFDNATFDNGITATVGFAAGNTGGPQSVGNALFSFDTAGSITDGMVLSVTTATAPYPPSGTGSVSPADAVAGFPVLFTVTTLPGGNPASTGIAVTGDLSSVSGSSTQQFFDNGSNGDVAADDGIFSYSYTIPAATPEGAVSIGFTVTDAQSRSSNGTATFTVDTAGSLIATAAIPAGSGELATLSGTIGVAGDVDVYKINICDQSSFSVTTAGGGTAGDTQLFLFNPDGTGVVMNDDTVGLLSALSNALVPANGDYYIAISRFDNDPMSSNGLDIWLDQPFGTERAPDGTDPTGILGSWTGGGLTGAYVLTFTGTCYPGATGPCSIADVGMAGGEPGQDNLLDNNDFIAFINFFFAQDAIADMGVAGGEPGSDGFWDNNDFIAFINHFFEDSAACNG